MLNLFPEQAHWLWENFDKNVLKVLVEEAVELKNKEKGIIKKGNETLKDINAKIESEKKHLSSWVNKNKKMVLPNGQTLEELSNFKF